MNDSGHCLLEVLLRRPDTEDRANKIKDLLRIISLSDLDSHTKKTILLKTLQNHLSSLSINETLLKTLELLEELFRHDAFPVTATMSAAYCAVAVECTLRYLQLQVKIYRDNPPYFRAVNRIWRDRISHMNSSGSREGSLLFSVELERWRRDIETSVLDLQVRERLASIDTKRDAIVKLRAFLEETCTLLGTNKTQQNQEGEVQSAAAENLHLPTTIEVEMIGNCISGELLVEDSLPTTIER